MYNDVWENIFALHRVPQFMTEDGERRELSRITFVFETVCASDCKFYFLAVSENVPTFFVSWCKVFMCILSSTLDGLMRYMGVSLQGYSEWNNNVIEQWKGRNRKQSYSYLIQSNDTVSFTWTFQRAEDFDTVRHMFYSWTMMLFFLPSSVF